MVFLLILLAQTVPSAGTPQTATAEIVVEGSRISEPAATIESAEALDLALPATALEVIETLPDIRAVSTGGAGGTSFVSVRGAEPNFAQILIDGVSVSNPSSSQGGGFDFAQLDPALVDSVAIVPTSRSAVHGSDALSGVISVRLPSPRGEGTSGAASLTTDTVGGFSANGRLSMGWDSGGLLLAGSRFDSGDLTPASDLERRQLLAKATQQIGGWDMSAFALYGETDRSTFPESSGGPRLAANRARETRETRFVASGLSLSGPETAAVSPSVRIGYYDDNVLADTPAIYPGIFAPVPALVSDTDFDRLEITGDLRFRPASGIELVTGAGYRREAADSIGTIDIGFPLPTAFAIARNQISAYAEGEWRPAEGLRLAVATRHDRTEGRGETTAQASVEYSPSAGNLTFFGGYAEGFHLPSLFALAFPLTANPDLRPERSTSWEGGLRWQSGRTRLRASAFATDYVDLIDFDPVLFTTVNRAATGTRGASLSGGGRIGSRIEWNGSLTWVHIESETPLRGRPDWYGNVRVAWRPIDPVRLGAALGFNSSFLETSVPTGVIELAGHAGLDLFADWRASTPLTLSLALRNATDAHWEDAVGFPAAGRVLRARAAIAF